MIQASSVDRQNKEVAVHNNAVIRMKRGGQSSKLMGRSEETVQNRQFHVATRMAPRGDQPRDRCLLFRNDETLVAGWDAIGDRVAL